MDVAIYKLCFAMGGEGEIKMKQVKLFLKRYAPHKRYYVAFCCYIIFVSFMQKTGAISSKMSYFTYEFGLSHPWVIVYNEENIGMRRLVDMLLHSKMGVEWIPQYIFIDAALVFLVLALINFVYNRLFKTAESRVSN